MAQDCFLTFGICRQMIMMQPGKLSILPLESKQWVDVYMGDATTRTIPWPLTGTSLIVVCSHGGTDHCPMWPTYDGKKICSTVTKINGFVLGLFR